MKQIPRSTEIDRATLFALNWLRTYVDTEIAAIPGGGGGGVTDHGLLTGLADDDHPQYLNNARGDARYEALGAVSTHVAASDPHVQYQKESEKGVASGYASLDGSVKVPIAQLPTGAGASTVALGDDARFTDTRTPTDNTVSTVKLQNNAVDNTKLADMATSRIKGRVTAATGDPEDLTPTQVTAMLDVATTVLKGIMSSADKTKLDGVATGATANATDAALRDRSTHTGTQASSTVTAAATARLLGRVTAGAGAVEELTGTQATTLLDVATTSVKGVMSAADKTKLDGIATGATANATDAALRDRSTHTGTQASSTVTAAATSRLLGRITAGAGAVEELTGTQATTLLDTFTSTLKGLAPASGGGTTTFLRADGTWAAPPGGGGGGSLVVQEDDVTVDAAATTLDFGNGFDVTSSPAGEANVGLDLGEYTGTDLPVASGGTGASDAATARTNLGVGAVIANGNTADVVCSAADTYLAGSSLAIGGRLKAGTVLRWRLAFSKTAAGTAVPQVIVRFGTAGTTADTARLTWNAFTAQTAAADTGFIEIEAVVRAVSATGTVGGHCNMKHKNTTTGVSTQAQEQQFGLTSAAFDTTVSNLIAGVSVNPGASGVWTFRVVDAQAYNIT